MSKYAGEQVLVVKRALLDEIERERFTVLHQRISLTPIRKLWIAWRSWRRAAPPL